MVEKKFSTNTRAKSQRISCTSCGAPFELKAVGTTVRIACEYCGAVMNAMDPKFPVLDKLASHNRVEPKIPIGSRGHIKGVDWEVIGFMIRCDSSESYFWDELLLYNPYHGFRWLSTYNGHWTFLTPLSRLPQKASMNSMKLYGKTYKIFNRSKAKVYYVAGEFYWIVSRGDTSKTIEYIAPPNLLSFEKSGESEINWTYGEYIPYNRMKKIFKGFNGRPPTGVGACQPNIYGGSIKTRYWYSLASIFIMLFIVLVYEIRKPNDKVYSQKISLIPENKKIKMQGVRTPKFRVKKHQNNLQMDVNSKLFQQWLYFDVGLVNTKNGRTQYASTELQYYKGRDWSEGSTSKSLYFKNVPKGEYSLSFDILGGDGYQITSSRYKDNWKSGKSLNFSIRSDPVFWRNFFWLSFLLLIAPVYGLVRWLSFETQRWSQSSESDL